MHITAIEVRVVEVPRRPAFGRAYASALGASAFSEHAIVTVQTDEGIVGHGEICSVFKRRGRLYANEVRRILAPALLNEDPRRVAHLVARMDEALDGSEPAKAAIDMALFDIVGKAAGIPAYQLLGGMVRERIPLSYSIPFGAVEEMAAYARDRVADGFKTVKVKVGRDRRTDMATVKAVREAVGADIKVRVDANMAWPTPAHAISVIKSLEPYDPELIEQPLQPRDLDGLARIRSAVSVPIMADETVWSPMDAMAAIRRDAIDIVNVYVTEAGGLFKAAQIFAICEAAGVPCMIGSMPETGLGTVAQIHLGVAMTNLRLDSDACGVLYHEADLLKAPLRIEGGYAWPPTGPGLGVELDHEQVERFAVAD